MMSAKALVIGIVGTGSILAAGVGGYLAVRSVSPAVAQTADTGSAPGKPAAARDARLQAPEPAPMSNVVDAPEAPPKTNRMPEPPAVERPRPATRETVRARQPVPAPPVPTPAPAPMPAALPTTEAVEVPSLEPTPLIDMPPVDVAVLFEDLTIPENAVIGIRLDNAISSATARIEDRVRARVVRDVTVDGRVAVPSGATVEGLVTVVERGGRFRERSRLGVRFTTVVMPDDTRVPIATESIFRLGDAPGGEATAKIGASAVVGTILGAVIGGKKGATIGGAAGAAGGTAAVMADGPNDVILAAGTSLTVRLTDVVTIRVPYEP